MNVLVKQDPGLCVTVAVLGAAFGAVIVAAVMSARQPVMPVQTNHVTITDVGGRVAMPLAVGPFVSRVSACIDAMRDGHAGGS